MSQALTFQLQTDEIRVSKVFQEHAIGSRGLEVKWDISTRFSLESGEVQVRGRRVEWRRVPVASCKTDQRTGWMYVSTILLLKSAVKVLFIQYLNLNCIKPPWNSQKQSFRWHKMTYCIAWFCILHCVQSSEVSCTQKTIWELTCIIKKHLGGNHQTWGKQQFNHASQLLSQIWVEVHRVAGEWRVCGA